MPKPRGSIYQTAILAPLYKANRNRGVEILGLTFERKNDLALSKTALSRLLKRYDVDYDLLFAGLANKKVASYALPALSKVLALTTTILDKQGNVALIHTGYTGSATGTYYDGYVREFNQIIVKRVALRSQSCLSAENTGSVRLAYTNREVNAS
ncbi:hypothetical protein GCM10028805_06550 [Spirosoma harenae]